MSQALISCRSTAFVAFGRTSRRSVATRSADVETSTVTKSSPVIAPIAWEKDTETAKEVFAFGGSAPERANGRAAMLGFTSLALTELSTHTPALEQMSNAVPSIILVSLAFTFATIVPKLVSGTSLKELHEVASSSNLRSEGILGQLLSAFDQSLELWSGRLAMIGIVGLVAAETIKGDSFF